MLLHMQEAACEEFLNAFFTYAQLALKIFHFNERMNQEHLKLGIILGRYLSFLTVLVGMRENCHQNTLCVGMN